MFDPERGIPSLKFIRCIINTFGCSMGLTDHEIVNLVSVHMPITFGSDVLVLLKQRNPRAPCRAESWMAMADLIPKMDPTAASRSCNVFSRTLAFGKGSVPRSS